VDRVSIEGCTYVADFLKQVKKEFAFPVPSSSLSLVRPDGVEIHVGDSPASFVEGNSPASPLIVKKTTGPQISLSDKLKQLEVDFSMREINYLLVNEPANYSILMAPGLTSSAAQIILTGARAKIKSATKQAIGMQHAFFLEDPLNVDQGQTKSSLYYAFSESGGVYAAKVYNGHEGDFRREVEVSQALEHKNLVKFIKSFSIQGNTRHIILMPFFPRNVADFLTQHSPIPLPAIRNIARNCFDALCHMHSKGFCFADLKPSNIMLPNIEPGYATLVDYGATVPIGSSIIEFTEHYCLDGNTSTATEQLDWICLGTTLAQIAGFDVYNFHTAVDLEEEVSCSSRDEHLKQVIVSCLRNPSSSNIELALSRF
jgi:hypothetical protein